MGSNRPRTLVEYFLTEASGLAFVLREGATQPLVRSLGTGTDAIRAFAAARFRSAETVYELFHSHEEEWHDFMEVLSAPIYELTDQGEPLWIVLHDSLHRMPLHAAARNGNYLIERNPVAYAPSATFLYESLQEQPQYHRPALVIGDSRSNLPHARIEAERVAKILGTAPVLGDRAYRSHVLAELRNNSNRGWIHFSCHGYFDSIDALSSGILLASSENGEAHSSRDVLSVRDILTLRANGAHVTLSACETGVNKLLPGDELVGLTRAWLYAGARSVLVTLWPVDDFSTRILMELFYQNLGFSEDRSSQAKIDALCAAQCALLRGSSSVLASSLDGLTTMDGDADLALRLSLCGASYGTPCGVENRERAAITDRGVPPELAACLEGFTQRSGGGAPPYGNPFYWAGFTLVGDTI